MSLASTTDSVDEGEEKERPFLEEVGTRIEDPELVLVHLDSYLVASVASSEV